MTDRNEITRQIEELLGANGSHALAVAMLESLERHGCVQFNAASGYHWATDETGEVIGWADALREAVTA
jgi:hypothetical protein